MADFVDEKRREMQARLKELRPLVDEYRRLEAAVAALEGVAPAPAAPRSPARAARPAARRRRPNGASTGRRGRPKGSGTRGKEALTLVTAHPGITIPEIAAEMKIKQNYLYRVMPGLQQDGLVKKDGKGWYPVEAA